MLVLRKVPEIKPIIVYVTKLQAPSCKHFGLYFRLTSVLINLKPHPAINGLLLVLLGQFMGMSAAQTMALNEQHVDLHRPIQNATGSTLIANPAHSQLVAPQAALFCISGDIPQTMCFTTADLAQLPRTVLTVNHFSPGEMPHKQDDREHNRTRITYEGVLLRQILQRADILQGDQLRGSNLARYLVVEGADGYKVVFSLPEFDPEFGNRLVLLADRRDGHALAANEAPLRLVIPDDQRHARWVRNITRMRVMSAAVTPSQFLSVWL